MPAEVLIVGAGPAGIAAALTLVHAGARVRLVDRATFPRDKLCGDTVNPGSLALLDALGPGALVRAAGLKVRGMSVTGPALTQVTADYPDNITGIALTRRHMDHILLEAAVSAGVRFDDGVRVTGPQIDDEGPVTGVRVRTGGHDSVLPARIVIAADGRASRIASALGLSAFAGRPRRWAFGAYFEGVEGLADRGEMHVRADGYIGVAPLPGGVANVCCVGELQSGREPSLVRPPGDGVRGTADGRRAAKEDVIAEAIRSDPRLRVRFANATRVSAVTVLGPLAVDAHAAGCPGLLLAGDAAGFVDPITGDGLRFALQGGILAAHAALRELHTGVPQFRALRAARDRAFSRKWLVNRALRALVASPRGVALAARLSGHWQAPVRSLVAMAGDVALALDHQAA